MIQILHAADLHLGAKFGLLPPEKAEQKKKEQLLQLRQLENLGRQCQLVLLAGDLFDTIQGSEASYQALTASLETIGKPVFIAPGNHDYVAPGSPYWERSWPGNVHLFRQPRITGMVLEELGCHVWGAGFTSMDCPGLLEGFHAPEEDLLQLMVLHGDPTSAQSPTGPVTRSQVEGSGLDYLALGHIHKAGSFRAGKTLCAWPGCPMGTGFDETGDKGVLLVQAGESGAEARFFHLAGGRFADLTLPVGEPETILRALPPDTEEDIYRITLTGSGNPDWPRLQRALEPRFFHLELRNRTASPAPLWDKAEADSLEGVYFRLLRQAMEQSQGQTRQALELAARISRDILSGQEVELP